jgi:transposase
MDIVNESCAGLDVHKKSVVACALRVVEGELVQEFATFGAMTGELLRLADWLGERGVRQVAMESTGVYWKPVFQILEDQFEVMVVNAQHIKQVPGRKTDVKDAEWIARLLQHGLLRASFVPPRPIRELRDLTRGRTQLVRERATVVNRIQKVLEDAGIKLAAVASDVMGASGRAMIAALIAGRDDPCELAELSRRRLREKIPELREALRGRVSEHHRFLLRMLMGQVVDLESRIELFNGRIVEVSAPFEEAARRLTTIPGIGAGAAESIVAEIGTDMGRFPTSGHLASWAGLCPGNDQSAGKRRSGRTTKGDRWLRTTLVQAAWAASRAKVGGFRPLYARWVKRMGRKKALVALAHKLLVVVHRMLSTRTDYHAPDPTPKPA